MLDVITSEHYDRWIRRLRDRSGRARILKQVRRIQSVGFLVGDWKNGGEGVCELRVDVGPGYRVYLSIEGNQILLLLAGGEKHSQQRDIELAKAMLREWRAENA